MHAAGRMRSGAAGRRVIRWHACCWHRSLRRAGLLHGPSSLVHWRSGVGVLHSLSDSCSRSCTFSWPPFRQLSAKFAGRVKCRTCVRRLAQIGFQRDPASPARPCQSGCCQFGCILLSCFIDRERQPTCAAHRTRILPHDTTGTTIPYGVCMPRSSHGPAIHVDPVRRRSRTRAMY